jgi:hypothetical protein
VPTVQLDTAATYFENRLALARQANLAPAEVQFDLARSPLTDDELEAAVDKFRDTPEERTGWGFSTMLQEVLSTEPKRIPTKDLKALQERLVASGYVSPDMEPTGDWDESWYSGFRRAEWDQRQKVMSGHHWGAVDLETGLRALSYMLPASVLQGVVGAAKGLVAQTGETFERGGALGGAVTGGAIGATLGSVVPGIGTAIGGLAGAGAGAIGGFLADLFGEEEGEEDQTVTQNLIDALSPFEEYSREGGPQAFFEDLGYVLSAASLVRGAGLGIAGTSKAAGAVGAEMAGGKSLGQALLARPGQELGIMGSLTKGLISKAAPGSAAAIQQGLLRASPYAFAQRLGPQVAVKAFSGLAQAQMGSRLFGGLGAGTREKYLEARTAMELELGRDISLEEDAELKRKTASTTIEAEIAKAPDFLTGINADLPGTWGIFGMDLSNLGDISNLAAFVIYPERMLPFTGKATSKGINESILKLNDSSARTIEYAHAVQHQNPSMSFRKAVDWAKENVSPHQDAYMRVDFGLDQIAYKTMHETRKSIRDVRQGDLRSARADAVRQIRTELDETGSSPLLDRAVRYSMEDPTSFGAWLIELSGQGRGVDKLKNYWEAGKVARDIERQAKGGTVLPIEVGGKKVGFQDVPLSTARTERPFHSDLMAIDSELGRLEKLVAKVDRAAKRSEHLPAGKEMLVDQGIRFRREIAELKARRRELRKIGAGSRELRESLDNRVGVARVDFVDRDQYFTYAEQYKDLVQRRAAAQGPQKDMLNVEFRTFLEDLEGKGLIHESDMLNALKKEKPGDNIAKKLIDQGETAARPLKLRPEDHAKLEALGYKPVEAGDDFIFPDQIDQMVNVESFGPGDVSKLAGFVETAGFSLRKRDDLSLGQLRRQHTLAELQSTFESNGVKLSPEAALQRINALKEELNHRKGVNWGPFAIRAKSEGGLGLYKVDVRDLSLDEIQMALDDVTGVTPEVAEQVFHGIRRAASLGGDFSLKRPGETVHALGRALRVNGFVGFSDIVRTMHAKVPRRLEAPTSPGFKYRPKAELANSVQRARTMRALDEVSVRNNVAPQLVDFEKMKLDSLAEGQVKAGRWGSVDDFYRDLDVGYAEAYVADTVDTLFKRVEAQPSFDDLVLRARAYEDTKLWYEESAKAISELPLHGKHVLANGKEISDHELFTNILAAVSPQKAVRQDVLDAWEHFKAIKRGDDVWKGTTPAERGMLDDILAGRTIDTWGPARTTRLTKAGKEIGINHHKRQKVENFYQNLVGELDRVTNDGWMAKLFGYEGDKGLSRKQYDDITVEVKRVADELGWRPAHVQAALWAAKRDEFASHIRIQAVLAEDAGDFAKAARLREEAPLYEKATIGNYTDRIFAEASGDGYALLQRVQDEILGSASFGPDFPVTMRFFRNADFSTLVHEDAHLLRKLLSPEDVAQLERHYNVQRPGTAQAEKVTLKVGKRFDENGAGIFERTHESGGATWNPHTGSYVAGGKPGAGFAVAVEEGTARLITPDDVAFNDPAAFTRELKRFAKEKREQLSNPRMHIGTWKDDEGVHLDISEVIGSRTEAVNLGAARKQKAIFDLEKFEDVATEGLTPGWTREAEEAFAVDAERYFAGKLGMDAPPPFKILREAVGSLYSHVRQAGTETNLIPRAARKVFDEHYPDAMKALPEKRKLLRSVASKQVAGGAAVGAGVGAVEGDDFQDVIQGALVGAGAGLATKGALNRTYGYLPDYLTRANSALRYTLSFTFDMGRYVEQNQIGFQKHRLQPMLSPKHFVQSREWKTPYAAKVTGEEAWAHATRFWEEINGTKFFTALDDIDRRMFQRGMLGFSPRNFEIAQAFQLYQRGMPTEKIVEAIADVSRYGLGRAAAEKSANFIFFPFSFSKKMLTGLGDFVLQAPGRNLLIQEGLRRYHESEFDENLEGLIQKHLPLLEDLKRVNNLAFGLSPGRFFLEGMSDHRTGTGAIAQALASLFVPSGAATPIAQAAGNLADLAVNAFTPIVITGESLGRAGGVDGLNDIVRRYIPMVREIDEYLADTSGGFQAQLTAFFQGEAPDYQYQAYVDGIKAAKSEYEPMATALGYSSVDGFLSSDAGMAFQEQIEERKLALAEQYPTGLKLASSFESNDAIDARALADLGEKFTRGQTTEAEERILAIREKIERWDVLGDILNLDAGLRNSFASNDIRKVAEQWATDRRFGELWDRFFLRSYGPIRRVA